MTKFNLSMACAAAALALMSGCSPAAQAPAAANVDATAVASAIIASETQWNADWAARDPARIAGHYADNAVLMIPGLPTIRGREAIQAALVAAPLADPGFALTFHAEDVQVAGSGDVAFSRGTYEEHDTNAQTHQVDVSTGSYVTIYRKQADGSWLAVIDINTPQPAAVAAPAQP